MDFNTFSSRLIKWYASAKRNLPWREVPTPYKVWLSEVILQQTRVVQGLPYYLRFIEQFPTVTDLAAASEEQVLKLWQGLGYYSRAKNLHHTAKVIASEYGGVFPLTYKELIKLKGIGDYTASAIASICYEEPCAVVDGNVYRVLSRVFGIETPINSSEGVAQFKALATELLPSGNIGTYNQAIMEFGAIQCTPQSPDCKSCIFKDHCAAYHSDKVAELPVKLKKLKIKNRYFNYLVWVDTSGKTLLQRRVSKDIWQGLYEFPLIETSHLAAEKELLQLLKESNIPFEGLILYNETPVIHKLTHQHIHTQFWIVRPLKPIDNAILISELHTYPVSALTANFIKKFWEL